MKVALATLKERKDGKWKKKKKKKERRGREERERERAYLRVEYFNMKTSLYNFPHNGLEISY